MRCPACHTNLAKASHGGEPMLLTRAVIFRLGTVVLVCPKCKGDVPAGAEEMHVLKSSVLLFFERKDLPPGKS